MFKRPPRLNNKIFDELPKDLANQLLNDKKNDLKSILNNSIKTELKLAKEEKKKKNKLKKLKFIRKIQSILRSNKPDNKKALILFIKYYVKEINAGFRYYLFPILELILPVCLNFLLFSLTPIQFFKNFLGQKLTKGKVFIRGNKNLIKSLDNKGSLIFLPTHVSHIDSLVIAYALLKLSLMPPLWGAGLNLFTNFLLTFLMNSVGCYKIDRRKKNKLYLDTLKEYSTYQISKKHNSLFYPGGTRSRSGNIETKLKLGLLDTVSKAFLKNLNSYKNENDTCKIFIVPISLSYSVVPEAECLSYENFFGKHAHRKMLQLLQRKFSKLFIEIRRYYHIVRLDSSVYCTFGDPIDPLGNNLNSDGVSINNDGVPVNLKNSINYNTPNIQKHTTQKLAEIIANKYFNLCTIIPSQVFLYSIVEYITLNNPGLSDSELVRLHNDENIITKSQLKVRIKRTIKKLKKVQRTKGINLDPIIENEEIDKIVNDGINVYTKNYNAKPINITDDYIVPNKIPLIWYYSDRIRFFLQETNNENNNKKKYEARV